MLVTRMYAREDGESLFEDVQLEDMSVLSAENRISPRSGSLLYRPDEPAIEAWHNPGAGRPDAPKRLLNVILEGELIVEVSSGERRTFKPGSVLLAEDATGRGHRSWTNSCSTFVIALE